MAAAVVIVAGAAWFARTARPRPQVAAAGTPAVFRTETGRRDSVVLVDGTRVLLGAGSSLAVPAAYPADREVSLSGEAMFDVVHDSLHPFVVRTAEAVVTDIGTRFTVRSYAGAGAEVAVQSGIVALRATGRSGSVALQAGDAGSVSASGVVVRAPGAATDDAVAWLRGRVVFRDAPLASVRAELRRWYGVELASTDPVLATRHLTASFQKESRGEVLNVIALALGAKLEMRGDTAVLRAAGGAPRAARF